MELMGWTCQRACGSRPSSSIPVSSAAFSFLFCQVAAEETKRLSVNRCFPRYSPPSRICSPAQARHHTRACGSCGNMLITLQFLLLHIVHEWKREKKRWRKGSASLKKCVQSSVCVCVCKLFPPTLSLLSDLGLLVHSRDIFLKEKKKWKTSRSGRTDCLVLPLWLLEDWWLPPSWWCQGHAECFCWEWKDLSRHRSSHLWNLSVGMFLCLFIFKFCPVKTRKKKRCWTNSCAPFFFFLWSALCFTLHNVQYLHNLLDMLIKVSELFLLLSCNKIVVVIHNYCVRPVESPS